MAAAQRWPVATAGGCVALLLFFVMPNPLRVPQQNPTATAEYAPVPGGNPDDANANFGQVGLANSGGIGAGGEGSGFLPGSPFNPYTPPPPPQFQPRQKLCVGNPPRQTEDPLSPPCVPFFDGDNGGATWKGVTRDEIFIVFYNDLQVEGDLSTPYEPSDEKGNQGDYEQTVLVRTLKAQLRFFSQRYQTYGRRVHVIAYPSGGGPATRPSQRQGDALAIFQKYPLFASAALVDNAQDFYVEMAKRDVPSFGWNEDVPAKNYQQTAPYVWSFGPDQETENAWSADFICRKLVGETAKYARDPDLTGLTRKFGLMYPTTSQRGDSLKQLAQLLTTAVRQKCGLEFEVRTFNGNGAGQAATNMTYFKSQKVTTVICYCVPVINETTVTHMQNAATSLSYFPEWYWDHASAMDRPLWQQVYGSKRQPSFGVSYLWRQRAFTDSYAYRAYLSQEPNSQPNTRFNFEIYHILLNLFEAIQAAGPKLTPETVQQGMYTFKYVNPSYPFLPTGSYGDSGPSPYTFLDTAMAWWWDPTGTPPNGKNGEGCARVLYGGKRFYGPDWPRGDTDGLFDSSLPCTEDTRKIANPETARTL